MEEEPSRSAETEDPALEMWLEYNFPILVDKVEPDVRNNDLEATEENLKMLCLSYCLQSRVVPKIEEYMRKVIAPKFWSKFTNEPDEKQGFQNFTSSINELYVDSSKFLPMLKKLELAGACKREDCMFSRLNILDYFKLIIRATLLSQIPVDHTVIIEHFYKTAFNVFCNIEASATTTATATATTSATTADNSHNDSSSAGLLCEGCSQEQSNCQCQAIVDVFHETNKKLIELSLLERLVGSVLTSLIHIRIESHVSRACSRSFDASQLEPLENWLETVVVNWLIRIYSGGSARSLCLDEKVRNAINAFKQKLGYFLYETYTRVRIEQLFNIVIEYPESRAAIDDLRVCLKRTDLRKYLVRSLKEALKTRLLHPGVSTPDILTAYIAAIKALRQLDPAGLLLESITEPIKVYLRGREDTVRCVVSGLLDESSTSELADELAKGGESIQLDLDGAASPREERDDWENWQPDPVDADPSELEEQQQLQQQQHQHQQLGPGSGQPGRRRVADIISMLVNIYGSQDLFVNEYRSLLADRLLSQLNYQTDREIRHLELLKRRFGEHQLHHCEVMIKDIYDSKRIDGNIQLDRGYEAESASFATSALILSAQFWPPFKEDWKLELPGPVRAQLERYVKAYETLKGNRTLCWKAHLGSVNLDVETRDRKLNLNVSPIHATIILHFQERSEWSLDQLAEVMHVPATLLRRKIGYWLSQALLVETSRDNFALQEELAPAARGPARTAAGAPAAARPLLSLPEILLDDEEAESAMASASDQRQEELQVFWSYIVGMLTNLDSMPLERIHQMLKMFASQGSGAVECGLPELRHFLDKKVREHQLLFSGGLYKLPKP